MLLTDKFASKKEMNNRGFALSGMASAFLLWTTYFVMANMRPEYSFKYKAISELGSLDAPNLWFWNVLGYVIPGLLIAIFSIGLNKYSAEKNSSKIPYYGLALSGLFMTLSGIFPADMENRKSITTILHMIGSYGSYVSFLFAAFTYPKVWKKNKDWQPIIRPTLICVWLTIIFGSWYIFFPNIPSVGQRIVFLLYFLWIVITAIRLYRIKTQ